MNIKSPCKGCENESKPKDLCMPSCEKIKTVQEAIHKAGKVHRQSGFITPQDVAENPGTCYSGGTPNY